jgi:hypothetical protein
MPATMVVDFAMTIFSAKPLRLPLCLTTAARDGHGRPMLIQAHTVRSFVRTIVRAKNPLKRWFHALSFRSSMTGRLHLNSPRLL